MEACYYGHLTLVELLRERGATWLARDKAGLCPLHWAVDGGHIDVVQYILNDGMDVRKIECTTNILKSCAPSL